MVNLLVLEHGFVDETLDALRCPKNVPFIALSLTETIGFHNGFDKLGIGFDHFKEHVELSLLVLTWLRVTQDVHVVTIDLYKKSEIRHSFITHTLQSKPKPQRL